MVSSNCPDRPHGDESAAHERAFYRPGERVIFWYNLPDGSARAFLTEGFQAVTVRGDGTIDMTIPAAD